MFIHRSRAAIVALLLLVSSFTTASPLTANQKNITVDTPTLASQEGSCYDGNTWPSGGLGQHAFGHSVQGTSKYIDGVQGWLTARKLYPCDGLAISGWSAAMAANVQCPGTLCSSNYLLQLGQLTEAGNAGEPGHFVYTDDSGSGQYHKIDFPQPQIGVRYNYAIIKQNNQVRYEIRVCCDGDVIWSRNTGATWITNLKDAWWGWEVANMWSAPGICYSTCLAADLVGTYSDSSFSGLVTKTNIVPFCDEWDDDCADAVHRHVSGSSNEILNVETHTGFSQPNG